MYKRCTFVEHSDSKVTQNKPKYRLEYFFYFADKYNDESEVVDTCIKQKKCILAFSTMCVLHIYMHPKI